METMTGFTSKWICEGSHAIYEPLFVAFPVSCHVTFTFTQNAARCSPPAAPRRRAVRGRPDATSPTTSEQRDATAPTASLQLLCIPHSLEKSDWARFFLDANTPPFFPSPIGSGHPSLSILEIFLQHKAELGWLFSNSRNHQSLFLW